MKMNEFHGVALTRAAEELLDRRLSGEEIANIAFLYDSTPGETHDRATIAIRAFAMQNTRDQREFFAHQDKLHDIVMDLESHLA